MADPNLGVLLFIPYRHMEQRIIAALNRAGYPVTAAQAHIFQRINDEGSRLVELAEAASTTKQNAGFLVDQLEKQGYVERVPDPRDARARLVRITARGREAVAVAAGVEAAIEREWREHLGADETEQLRAALLRLRQITDPYA
ncbi:MarR family winged helix-turn-helix transcriptional regulator [Arthrobacter mobilis]|uniref:Winged helix DNA-binding protein n=1 Tax=Arthrobacter mobilis TaxID=2724944 RepID=A0A7X6K5X8_9MICC|nr:MarR family transcriptional regulator [Arthrobacter mobilis]NKX54425.1 winged helix DNA-binding protein [Arthrobacter mobilis]